MAGQKWLTFGFVAPLIAALLLMVAISCGGAATPTTAPQPETVAATTEDQSEGEDRKPEAHLSPTATAVPAAGATAKHIVAVATVKEPYGTLNIAEATLGTHSGHTRYAVSGTLYTAPEIHQGLFTVNRDSQYEGSMVKDWSLSDDNRVWTFKLHDGIEFSDGWGQVGPADIINAVRELGGEDGHCGCSHILGMFDNPNGYFVGLDDQTLELDTGTPSWEVLRWLTTPGSSGVFSKTQWDTLLEDQTIDEITPQLVGAGPYKMEEAKTGEYFHLTAINDHWRKTPEFANVYYHFMPEESTRIANFLTGNIDIWRAAMDSVSEVAELESTKFMSQGGAGTMFLLFWQNGYTPGYEREGYKPEEDPWTSSDMEVGSEGWENARKVREAIGYAVDRQKIVDTLLGGDGSTGALYGMEEYRSQWPDDWTYEYDVERAKELLAEAGYADGFDLTMTVADGYATQSVTESACLAIADMLGDVGISATMSNTGVAELYDSFKNRTARGITCQAITGFGGAEPIWFWRWSYDPAGTWGLGWDHPWYTEIMNRTYDTFNHADRWALQMEMGQWMRDNAMAQGVYEINSVYPLGPKVESWSEHLSMAQASRISAVEYATHRDGWSY